MDQLRLALGQFAYAGVQGLGQGHISGCKQDAGGDGIT
jgi:hypothetical protein